MQPVPRGRTPLRRLLPLAALCVAPLAATTLTVPAGPAAGAATTAPTAAAAADRSFHRLATYPVFRNVPDGVDPADGTVAEIAAVSADGTTIAYTDAVGGRIGFVDITEPAAPEGLGSYEVTGGSPTSVAIVDDLALVVVDESTYPGLEDSPWEDEPPAYGVRDGRLEVVRLSDRTQVVPPIDLGGQPDSIAISPDGTFAAIAMENQRNEGLDDGEPPQEMPGEVAVLDIDSAPAGWTVQTVALPEAALAEAGLAAPSDAEPEYVDIDDDNRLVVTLQENNGFAVVDLATASLVDVFSAGSAEVPDVDVDDDRVFDFTADIVEEREPDAVQWVGEGLVATANEGDWNGGSRGWTVFDATTGEVVWDAGNSFEYLAVEHGLFNDGRADNKGSEPEGLAFAEYDGTPYAFVGSERSNFVAVYDMTTPSAPVLTQVLPTTMGPEGLLPVPGRDLFVVSSEEDDAPVVRAALGIYRLGAGSPAWPSLVSAKEGDAAPIGWGALSALSRAPGRPQEVWAASDIAFTPGRLYRIDLSRRPAVITEAVELSGGPEEVDVEGLAARSGGGFWVASEGRDADPDDDVAGLPNLLLRTDGSGVVQETVPLPTAVEEALGNQGLEGVTVTGSGASEQVYVALQRALPGETRSRIGRYTPATGAWTWFGYPLSAPTSGVAGDWIGVSEVVALDRDTLAVVERDKQAGSYATFKRVYTVDLPRPRAAVTPLRKRLAEDLLDDLRAPAGWAQEKVEGLAVTTGGRVVAVTDNDGLDDNAGETHLLRLGTVRKVLGTSTATRIRAVRPAKPRRGTRVTVVARVQRADGGRATLLRFGREVATKRVPASGRVTFVLRGLKAGRHRLKVRYAGTTLARPSVSKVEVVRVRRR